MLFNSLHFLVFFPLVFFLYYALPYRLRNSLLLMASVYFYLSWKPLYILVILGTTSIDYLAAICMSRTENERARRMWLLASLSGNLAILFFFKYVHFVLTTANDVSGLFGGGTLSTLGSVILPLGISFHTFQGMGYAIDVYRKKIAPQTHYFRYALFVMFFPQLVAGPIERAGHLLAQFDRKVSFDYVRVTDGLKLAAWGMFKKVVIADRLAPFVDQVYQHPEHFAGPSLALATVFFAFQIYCDFSGYSDIALGTAQMLGFDLMQNFNRPYVARSIHEFWQRWHISLSTWFRDYVYVPLGGNRVPESRWRLNILATFTISGLWHGAAWTFVIWGFLNGAYVICSSLTANIREAFVRRSGLGSSPTLHKYLNIIVTFTLVCVAWVFFRASSVHDALYILTHWYVGAGEWCANLFSPYSAYAAHNIFLDNSKIELFFAFIAVGLMELVHQLQGNGDIRHLLAGRSWYVRWPIYVLLMTMIVALGQFGDRQFIYFTF